MIFTYDDPALAPDTVSFSSLDGSHDADEPHADSPTIWSGGYRGGRAIAGQARALSVGDGLAVCVADFSATRDAVQRETRTGDVYQIGFCLQGALAWRGEDGCERTIESGQGWIHRVMPGSYESAFFRGQACRTVSVAASPHRLARALGEGGIGSFPQHELIAVTPELSDVLSRLRERPKASGAGKLYLEGKAIEALALSLEQASGAKRLKRRATVSAEDWRAIAQAHAIIEREYARPLTIASLSRRVLLNECKLKAGFKACFGTTIHSFVRACRMREARRLIECEGRYVKDAAWMVGYTNVSHFIEAFRAQFGETPGSLR